MDAVNLPFLAHGVLTTDQSSDHQHRRAGASCTGGLGVASPAQEVADVDPPSLLPDAVQPIEGHGGLDCDATLNFARTWFEKRTKDFKMRRVRSKPQLSQSIWKKKPATPRARGTAVSKPPILIHSKYHQLLFLPCTSSSIIILNHPRNPSLEASS